MKRHTAIAALLLIPALMSTAQQVSETKLGLRVDPSGDNPTTEVSVYAPNIIRVTKYADGLEALPAKKSYSVIMTPEKGKDLWSVEGNTLRTACLTVTVDAATGEVRFADAEGNALLAEKGAAEVAPIATGVDKGQYRIRQDFQLGTDEAIYGLGQRRSPKLNQRGEKVEIWNHNANITIPYFTSVKGYGLYWDNAGRSHFEA